MTRVSGRGRIDSIRRNRRRTNRLHSDRCVKSARKVIFVKDDLGREENSISGWIKESIALIMKWISKKDAGSRSRVQACEERKDEDMDSKGIRKHVMCYNQGFAHEHLHMMI